jgi:hypothetical protein
MLSHEIEQLVLVVYDIKSSTCHSRPVARVARVAAERPTIDLRIDTQSLRPRQVTAPAISKEWAKEEQLVQHSQSFIRHAKRRKTKDKRRNEAKLLISTSKHIVRSCSPSASASSLPICRLGWGRGWRLSHVG